MGFRRFAFGILAFFSLTSSSYAHFEKTRIDPSVPSNCSDFEVRDFAAVGRLILAGPEGAKREGFTHEYPIARREATTLWEMLRSQSNLSGSAVAEVPSNSKLRQKFLLLSEIGPRMGFDFGKEGDVLEALVLHQLKQEFPEKEYFLTGGIAYRERPGTPVLGELDIIIGRRSDCAVVVLGEAKLGIGQRNHALGQLKRFTDFAKRRLCAKGDREPICGMR